MKRDRHYHLSLPPMDFGQMIDGLSARRDAWAETARWFRGECKDPCFNIEECSDEEEAQGIADHYGEIIGKLQAQVEPQRERKEAELLERPAEGQMVDGWCLYVDALSGGRQPAERYGDDFAVYASERDAQEECAQDMIGRYYEFLRGEREAEAIDNGLFVMPVTLHGDGTLVDEYDEHLP